MYIVLRKMHLIYYIYTLDGIPGFCPAPYTRHTYIAFVNNIVANSYWFCNP
jgi:hypothetical protein